MKTASDLDTSLPLHGRLVAVPASSAQTDSLVGDSEAMQRLRLQLKRIGPYFRTALVSGEPGTGKSRVAAALHKAAGLHGECVTCEIALLERATRSGGGGVEVLWALARSAGGGSVPDGSIFFDRIGEASPGAQDLVLRWMHHLELERRTWGRVGVRVIASSHEDLRVLRTTGRFRPELYERLAMVEVRLTPLRERKDDIAMLARHFVAEFSATSGRATLEVSGEAMQRLNRHTWPGNVRELQSVLRGAVLEASGGTIEASDLPIFPEAVMEGGEQPGGTGLRRLQEVVDEHVLGVMHGCSGNKLRAAETLGVSRSTLYRMLEAAGAGSGQARI